MLVWDTAQRAQLASWKVTSHFTGRRHCCRATADGAAALSCCLFWLLPAPASRSTHDHKCVQVPGCSARGGLAEACGFAATRSGGYICAGNTSGDVRVYDTHNSKQVALVSPIKVTMLALAQHAGQHPAHLCSWDTWHDYRERAAAACCLPRRRDAGPTEHQVYARHTLSRVGKGMPEVACLLRAGHWTRAGMCAVGRLPPPAGCHRQWIRVQI